jgi:hypothetical protein
MSEQITTLLAAASQVSAATSDLIEATREGAVTQHDNVGSGDTATILADGLRLLLLATSDFEDSQEAIQLLDALERFIGVKA